MGLKSMANAYYHELSREDRVKQFAGKQEFVARLMRSLLLTKDLSEHASKCIATTMSGVCVIQLQDETVEQFHEWVLDKLNEFLPEDEQ